MPRKWSTGPLGRDFGAATSRDQDRARYPETSGPSQSQNLGRINSLAIAVYLKVEVGACAAPRRADRADDGVGTDLLAGLHVEPIAVRVGCAPPSAVVDDNRVPEAATLPCKDNLSTPYRANGCPSGCCDVQSTVKALAAVDGV